MATAADTKTDPTCPGPTTRDTPSADLPEGVSYFPGTKIANADHCQTMTDDTMIVETTIDVTTIVTIVETTDETGEHTSKGPRAKSLK